MEPDNRKLEPLRALLVDDEPPALANLRAALLPYAEIDVIGAASDGHEAVRLVRLLEPDLLFLDVQMPGLDGFGVLRALHDVEPPAVVFVTAFEEHAVQAFEVHALDYLLKPFDDARLHDCVHRALARFRNRQRSELRSMLQSLLRHMAADSIRSEGAAYTERFCVRERERLVFVAADDVDWFQAAGNYVRLHAGPRQHLIRSSLADLQQRLDTRRFARIHRSCIVNVSRIREIQPWVGGDYVAILHDGQRLKVSRTFRDELLRPYA